MDLAAELADLEHRSCLSKQALGRAAARNLAVASQHGHTEHGPFEAYECHFCGSWHVGHALSMAAIAKMATLLRARAGNAPTPPGSGTTRRQRRKDAHR